MVKGGIPGTEAPDCNNYSDCIKHVDPSVFPLQPHYTRDRHHLIHPVALLRDENILSSLQSIPAVIIISRETGKIIWHLGSTVLAQQHHATELEDGLILTFDNGVYRHDESFPYSRVIQVDRATKQIVWQYREKNPMTLFNPFMGGAQRLANGNTLITEAANGRLLEITREGGIV
ncbi:hypothetical protein D0861_07857 [Hortaea werneckii]|uniref:Uncharacterized protein n=1 Tax=Hortaea werneckii TaxID=91943 RepID=A0A3M7F136_HORWE|nr:hypothetical protein D0861_07857 [Hortaea werneckii]